MTENINNGNVAMEIKIDWTHVVHMAIPFYHSGKCAIAHELGVVEWVITTSLNITKYKHAHLEATCCMLFCNNELPRGLFAVKSEMQS